MDILPKKLVLNGNASLYRYDYMVEKFNKAYQLENKDTNTTREASVEQERYTQQQYNATLTYTDTFADKHNLEVMLGGEYFTYDQFKLAAKTQNSPTDDIPTLNVGATRTETSTTKSAYRILSSFGRLNYNYEMKYLLSVVFRYDGISKLKDNRWGFFPGVSAGWNITEEQFWKDSNVSDLISTFKPRLSYGVNGNVNGLGNYTVYGEYATTKPYGGETVYTIVHWLIQGYVGNRAKALKPDLILVSFNNRLSFILDYYNRKTKICLPILLYQGIQDLIRLLLIWYSS